MNKKEYAWSRYQGVADYSGGFDTIEQCIEDAKFSGCKAGETIYVGECKTPKINGIYFEDVLEDVHDQMYDEVGELADDWDIEDIPSKAIYNKYEEKLRNLVLEYIKELDMEPDFFKVVNVVPIVIK